MASLNHFNRLATHSHTTRFLARATLNVRTIATLPKDTVTSNQSHSQVSTRSITTLNLSQNTTHNEALNKTVASSPRTISSPNTTYITQLRRHHCASSKLDLSGIFPPIVTPFDVNENIAFDKLDANLEKWNRIPFRGYVVLGSNGETAYLQKTEKIALVKHLSKSVAPEKVIIAGVGCESTRDTISLTNEAAEAGAHCALVLTPSFFRGSMTNAAFHSHFTKVADASPIPVLLYNVPANTAIDLDPSVIIDLSQHPNIVGLKDSGGDITKLTRVVHETRTQDFQVLAGSAGFLYPSFTVGCVGGVCALANVLGDELCQLYDLYVNGRFEEALKLQQTLVVPNTAITKTHGVAGLKYSMALLGYYGGPTRAPLLPLSAAAVNDVERIFRGFKKTESIHSTA